MFNIEHITTTLICSYGGIKPESEILLQLEYLLIILRCFQPYALWYKTPQSDLIKFGPLCRNSIIEHVYEGYFDSKKTPYLPLFLVLIGEIDYL